MFTINSIDVDNRFYHIFMYIYLNISKNININKAHVNPMSEEKKDDKKGIYWVEEALKKETVRVITLKPNEMPKSLKPKEKKK